MSVTIDANVLLYASDAHSPRHRTAHDLLQRLAEGPGLVYVFWPVAMAYLRIATHPSVFEQPLDPDVARGNLGSLLDRAHVRCPGEGSGFWQVYETTVGDDVIRGNLVTDAHIAALMRQHGVDTIWTADRDFRRFADVTARDPYAATKD
ncbi:MAG: PIN domain-containing protein [Pseudonocardiaceae bacterium]|nr:PIN domain-containing protein [Pseudonocardiaceae bacterium]